MLPKKKRHQVPRSQSNDQSRQWAKLTNRTSRSILFHADESRLRAEQAARTNSHSRPRTDPPRHEKEPCIVCARRNRAIVFHSAAGRNARRQPARKSTTRIVVAYGLPWAVEGLSKQKDSPIEREIHAEKTQPRRKIERKSVGNLGGLGTEHHGHEHQTVLARGARLHPPDPAEPGSPHVVQPASESATGGGRRVLTQEPTSLNRMLRLFESKAFYQNVPASLNCSEPRARRLPTTNEANPAIDDHPRRA